MPRGNDQQAALRELADKYGQGVGNAEQLIEANLARVTPELRRAEMIRRDPEKTAEVRKHLDKLKGPNGEKVVDAAVRGDTTVVVYEDENGAYWTAALDDKDKAVVADLPEGLSRLQQGPQESQSGVSPKAEESKAKASSSKKD